MKKMLAIFTLSLSSLAHAGFNGLTVHSRANCFNNESISWDATTYRILATESLHAYDNKPIHWDGSGWENTWRSAAVCWNEAPPSQHRWVVEGHHHLKACWNCSVGELGTTRVADCSVYNGWWDKNKLHDEKPMKKTIATLLMIPLTSWSANVTHQSRIQILPDDVINKDLPDEIKQKQLEEQNEFEKLGYATTNSQNAKKLLNMAHGDMVAIQSKGVKDINNPYDTHLKYSYSNIQLALPFKGIPLSKNTKIIGFAPIGMWMKDKNGWSGVVEYFNEKEIGICRFSLSNIGLTNGSVQIPQSKVRYDVNNKPTTLYVLGSQNDGFIYTAEWYTNSNVHTLECANKKYDKEILNKVVALAKRIDKTS